jgi:hypothetical protein
LSGKFGVGVDLNGLVMFSGVVEGPARRCRQWNELANGSRWFKDGSKVECSHQ